MCKICKEFHRFELQYQEIKGKKITHEHKELHGLSQTQLSGHHTDFTI